MANTIALTCALKKRRLKVVELPTTMMIAMRTGSNEAYSAEAT
jgi:hypothetical protein